MVSNLLDTVFAISLSIALLFSPIAIAQEVANKSEQKHDGAPKRIGTIGELSTQLLQALEVDDPIQFNNSFTAGGVSEFDCVSQSNKVAAACRMACGVAQNLGCGCSTLEDGCSCECHGTD